jgi:uncharacterized membrane protein YesL
VKTIFNFRKLLVLCAKNWSWDVFYTYKAQFLESNLTFHTVSVAKSIFCVNFSLSCEHGDGSGFFWTVQPERC